MEGIIENRNSDTFCIRDATSLNSSDFIRYENTKITDENYVSHMLDSIKYFDNELIALEKSPESEYIKKYPEIMRNSHVKACYKTSEHQEPGIIRKVSLAVLRPNAIKYAQTIAALTLLPEPMPGKIAIKNLSNKYWPQNTRDGHHYYPHHHMLKHYFTSAGKTLYQISQNIRYNKRINGTRKLIGTYYHTMVNARPFGNVNNSLLMVQVNYLLKRTGHEGLLHGDLDHLFTRFSIDHALTIWEYALRKELPPSPDLKITIEINNQCGCGNYNLPII